MWTDLQQTFYITLAPYIQDVLLPVFIGLGIVLAFLYPLSQFWRPTEKISFTAGWDRDE